MQQKRSSRYMYVTKLVEIDQLAFLKAANIQTEIYFELRGPQNINILKKSIKKLVHHFILFFYTTFSVRKLNHNQFAITF